MSSFAEYKMHSAKKTTPITWFNCSYCGKYQSRRTSKIKNPNLIFCDNLCRAKYVTKQAIKFHFTNEDIQPYLFEFKEEINKISAYIAKISRVPDVIMDLRNEAPYCIWKCLQNKKTEKIKKDYFCKYYERYLFSYLRKFEFSLKYASIDFYEDTADKVLDFAYFHDITLNIDAYNVLKQMIIQFDKLPVSCKIAIDREILEYELNQLMEKYNMTRRQIIYNCSKGKELLRMKFKSMWELESED